MSPRTAEAIARVRARVRGDLRRCDGRWLRWYVWPDGARVHGVRYASDLARALARLRAEGRAPWSGVRAEVRGTVARLAW